MDSYPTVQELLLSHPRDGGSRQWQLRPRKPCPSCCRKPLGVLKGEPQRFLECMAGHRSRPASAVSRAFRLLACTLGVSLVAASCIGSAGEEGFSAEEFDSLVSRLADPTSGSANVSAFARADSLCAGASPDSVTGGEAVDSSSGSDPAVQLTPRLRDRVREELVGMGFRACVRAMSRTVQQDAWLRHDRLTELVAWKADAAVKDAIYVPVRYRVPVRGEAERSDSSWVRPVAAVLEAVRAFLADSARAANGEPSDGAARKPIVLSFTSAKEPNGLDDIPATGESRRVGTAWVASAAGPQSPRVTTPYVGWMVGKLRSSEGRVSFPGPETGLPVRLADLKTGLPGSALCGSGERCDLIVPANPAVHVHAMFFPGDFRVGTAEARRMGERTLEVLLAADTSPYGVALPVSRAELRALLWWLLPCALLVFTVWWAFIGLLGSISTAIRIARRARMGAGLNRLLARVRQVALGIVLSFLRRFASEREISEGTGKAITRPKRLYEEADEALRNWADTHVGAASSPWADELLKEGRAERSRIGRWAEEADAWKERRGGLFGSVQDCRGFVRTCEREAKEARSAEKAACERMDGIGHYMRGVQEQLELARQLKRKAGEARVRAKVLGKEARHLAGRADQWAVRVKRGVAEAGSAVATPEPRSGKAAEARASAAEAMRAAAKAVRRDAKALKAAARELRFEAASALQEIAGLRYETARDGLACLIKCLRKKRDKKRDHLATSFNRLGRVLAKFCTLSWNGQVLACGVAALVAAVHGFIVRVDDPILNVALSGVGEDVWTLVYIGLGAMVFLASALEEKNYSIGKRAEDLRYWNKKARRIGTESKRPVSLLAGLKRRSRLAVFFYVLLLLMVIATSCNAPVPGLALDALRNSAAPPWNPLVLGVITLDHAILLVLVVAFVLPAGWVLWHLQQVPKDGS